ncbi:hypothetical protein C8Q79DRAFT_1065762, partial [Trametes meyenii]
MCNPRELDARKRIGRGYIGDKSTPHSVHSVTFQPRGPAWNQDRVLMDKWNVCGQYWLFFAVLDGHSGNATADHTSRALPTLVRRKLRAFIQGPAGGRLGRRNLEDNAPKISTLFKSEIESFDQSIGDALRKICPRPWELSEEQARELIEKHEDVVERAFSGTTLACTLVNIELRCVWAAIVGDSSIGLSVIDVDGTSQGQRLCDVHSFKDPKEYFRAVMAHPYIEQPLFESDRLLGWFS